MARSSLPEDPRGLIREAYRMDLTPADCRSIFLDWVLGQPGPAGAAEIRRLLEVYGEAQPGHPMTAVLTEGLAGRGRAPVRRGGAKGRRSG